MNRITHFEIHADDTSRAINFYKTLFGWEFTKWENPVMEYWMIMSAPAGDKSEGINGGLLKRMGPPPVEGAAVNAFPCTIVVENIDKMMEMAVANGGSIALPKYALAGMAWQGYCKDTEGNIFGLHQTDPNAK